jgi:HlyD family secretion protein
MRTRWKVLLVVPVLVGASAAAYQPAADYWRKRSVPNWRTAEVTRGKITEVINSTGAIKPQMQVSVGSFVSGPIDAEYQLLDRNEKPMFDQEGQPLHIAEFNQEVKQGDQLAKIDERIYMANFERDDATFESRKADVERAQAVYDQSVRDLARASELRRQDVAFVAQSEMDKLYFSVKQNRALLVVSDRAVNQAESQRANSKANLDYCTITAPEDGIIIDRKIEPGQTLAAQFQTPELFIIGVNMREAMNVHAQVEETDIGQIKEAKLKEEKLRAKDPEAGLVSFTVSAYPNELFHGHIEEIRMSSTTTQNIVSYPVVVRAKNPELKLMPGMTADISFEVDSHDGVLKIPNAALRYFPEKEKMHVRKEDQKLLEGKVDQRAEEEEQEVSENSLSAEQRAELRQKRNRRHVWVQDGLFIKAVEVQIGLADGRHTELVAGDLQAGDKLITGVQPPKSMFGGP